MPGYCTHCGGSGFRNPAKEAQREARALRFVREVAAIEHLHTDFQSEEGCDKLNDLITEARRLLRVHPPQVGGVGA